MCSTHRRVGCSLVSTALARTAVRLQRLTNDAMSTAFLLTSDNAPEVLRNQLVLHSDESFRSTCVTERGQLQPPCVKEVCPTKICHFIRRLLR